MNQDTQLIRGFVRSLVRRERLIIVGRVVLQVLLLSAMVLAFAVVASAWHWDRPASTAGMVLLSGIGLWGFALLPLLLRWRAAGDVMRQAGLVESVRPDLRGRMLTAVERTDGPVGNESAALVGLLARRTAAVLADEHPSRVHSIWPLLPLSAGVGTALMVSLLALLLSPLGVSGTWAWWTAIGTASASTMGFELNDQRLARVGDIVLRYTYPAYTGLQPLEIENSTGDAMGPPGTVVQVFARSDVAVEAGALVAYDEPALDAEVSEAGRLLSGTFSIAAEEGAWRLITYRDGQPRESRDFSITPELDLAPEVMLVADEVIEVAVDEVFGIPWRVRDDYGVKRVQVEIDGIERGRALARPSVRQAEVSGTVSMRPLELGLLEGDSVKLVLAGWDNDTYSGSKAGRSPEITIVVLGESGLNERDEERQTELRDLMLGVLADFLEEPWPPGFTGGDLAKWGEGLAARYQPMEDLVEAYQRSSRRTKLEGDVLRTVTRTGSELIRYTQVAFTPGSTAIPPDTAWDMTTELRDNAIEGLEDGILALDRKLRMMAFRQVADKAEDLADFAAEMADMLAQPEPDPLAMLAQLDRLEEKLSALMEAAAKMEEGGLKEFVNARSNEMQSLMEEIRKALAEGRMDEAAELMKRLEQQMREMSEWVQDEIEGMQQQGDDTMQQAQDLQKELAEIEQAQRELQKETQQLQEKSDKAKAERIAKLWEELEQTTSELSQKSQEYTRELTENERAFYEQERAKHAGEETDRFDESVAARDLHGSKKGKDDAEAAWNRSEYTMERELQRQGTKMKGPGRREMGEIGKLMDRANKLLDDLDKEARTSDPNARRQARQMQQQQQGLEQRLQQAKEAAEQLARDFPVRPDGLEEALDDAEGQMQQSGQDLRDGQPMPSEGAQGVAAQRLKDAQDALQQAMQQAQQQNQGLSKGQGQPGDQPQSGNEGQDMDTPFQMEIPGAEDDFSAEEYRRQLLEGMEGDVPEEYRAWKKRYFEELVRQ